MNEYLISLYIDDELKLQEKIEFVENIHTDNSYYRETIALLEQEVELRDVHSFSQVPNDYTTPSFLGFLVKRWWSAGVVTALLACFILVAGLKLFPVNPVALNTVALEDHRFVLYFPTEEELNIIGTFTNWKPVPMQKVGSSGYWNLTLSIPEGEHKYSYMVGDGEMIADPTIPAREKDDFGGENSVIQLGEQNVPVS
ncbi:MAG: glycogen-binding domain-containing protein [Desulfopila sp.]|jgi:hypothetical protein|nr:glycogen-binding domain-containing protein [Desulfopila sp.]